MYWHICWKYVTPVVLLILLIFDLVNFGHIRFKEYVYPLTIQLLGQAITGISLIWIPIFAFLQKKSNNEGNDTKMWLLKPTQVSYISLFIN